MAITIKLLLTAFFWGGTFIAGRILAAEVGPFSGAFLRFLVAAASLALFLGLREGLRLPRGRGDVLRLLLMGMTGVFFYNVFFLLGLKEIEAGRAAVLIANNPIGIALGAALFLGERMNAGKIAGILISVSGAVIVITRGDPLAGLRGGFGWGEGCILLCVVSWVAYSLLGKQAMGRLSPLAAVTWSAIAGVLGLLPFALLEGVHAAVRYSPIAWGSILYLGLCGTTIGFLWYYEGIQTLGPVRAGLFINFVPVFAVLLAALLLSEPLTASLLAGAGLVTAGVVLTTRAAH